EPEPFESGTEPDLSGSADSSDDPFAPDADERHPLLERAMNLLHHLHKTFKEADPSFEHSLRPLFQGAGDAMGGLAQALSGRDYDWDDYGLRLTQLKRAQRGAAFARGALFSLRAALTPAQFDDLFRTIGQFEKDIFRQIGQLRL